MGNRILQGFEGTIDMAADGYSDDISIGHAKMFSIQTDVDTDDGYGYLRVQASNNRDNWADIYFVDENGDTVAYKEVLGADLTHIFDVNQISAGWARLKYEMNDSYGSGTGTVSFFVNAKR